MVRSRRDSASFPVEDISDGRPDDAPEDVGEVRYVVLDEQAFEDLLSDEDHGYEEIGRASCRERV